MAIEKTDVLMDNGVDGKLQYKTEESSKVKKVSEHEGAFVSLRHIDKIYDNNVQAVFDFNLDIKSMNLLSLSDLLDVVSPQL